MIGFSADQAPTRPGAAQNIEPVKKPEVPPRSLFVTFDIVDFEHLFFAVSINVRNGVTGSLGDYATLKLVDQEDKKDEDLLPQAASQDGRPDDEYLRA